MIDTKNKEFQDALALVQYTRNSIFLTGKAGTGKSTFLKYLCQHTKKKLVVLAPTGIAAINAGGNTLHSFFKLPFYPLLPDDPNLSLHDGKIHSFFKYTKEQRKLLKEVELIIIDEISMVRADIIDTVDRILRVYSGNMREPFGGKQLLLVGDIFQLEPVVKSDERDILSRFYSTPYFFSARVYREMQLVSIELRKVYRQNDDIFISVLDKIRNNQAGSSELQLLNTRYGIEMPNKHKDMYITLAARRNTVDFINEKRLSELTTDPFTLQGNIDGDFPENSLPTLLNLELKEGAQIIFIKNDMQKRWVNGTIGIVRGFNEENGLLYILTDDGREVGVEQEVWNNVRYSYNEEKKEVEQEILGSFTQFPVRLAWAITIHKSQGQTFSNVVIDFTGGVFAGGQTYVALSRCTSLDGIILKYPIQRSDIFIRKEVIEFAKSFNDRMAIERAMKQAQADIDYRNAVDAFNHGNFEEFTNSFFKAIHENYRIESPLAKRFIRYKLQIINRLKEENRLLKEEIAMRRNEMKDFAKEYYLMGNSCIVEAHNASAALANYDKALSLDPQYTDAWVRKGVTLFDMGRHSEALECVNKAVELRPMQFKGIYNRGKIRLKMGDIDGAINDFDKATTIKPEHPNAHQLFGDALIQKGLEEVAALQWRIAEELHKKKKKRE